MTYEDLLLEAEQNGLIIKEKPFKAYNGRIKGNKIAIKKDLSNTGKKCTLVEELGHYHTTTGNILDQSKVENRKQERKARAWGYERLVGVNDLINALKFGVRNRYELAEYLNVTENYIEDALEYYKQKHGVYYQVDKFVIYFEPLGILEMWD